MEELKTLVYNFFHDELFLIILGGALVNNVVTFRSFMIARSEKNFEERQKKGISLFLSAGIPFLAWGFYSMSFQELGFYMLNLVTIITFSTLVVAGIVSYYDEWKLKQKTLDHFM